MTRTDAETLAMWANDCLVSPALKPTGNYEATLFVARRLALELARVLPPDDPIEVMARQAKFEIAAMADKARRDLGLV